LRTIFFSKLVDGKRVYPDRKDIVESFQPDFTKSGLNGQQVDVLQQVEDNERNNISEMSTYPSWFVDGPAKAAAVYSDKSVSAKFQPEAWKQALNRLDSQLSSFDMYILSFDEALHGAQKPDSSAKGMDLSTNSGYPFWLSHWWPNDDTDPKMLAQVTAAAKWYETRAKEVLNLCNKPNVIPEWVATAGQRLVQKNIDDGYNPKRKRLIIAFDKTEAINVKMFSPSVIDNARTWRMPGGVQIMCGWQDLTANDIEMQRMLSFADRHARTVLSGDVSNYDATLPPKIILDVVRVIARHFKGHENLFFNLGYAMLYNTWLITPSKIYQPQPSSLKSGSGLTNLLGSMVNICIQWYGEAAGLYKLDNMAVLGDDFVIDGDGVSPEATAECFDHFGMESHPDKQFFVPGALHYLKRVHFLGIPGGIASVNRTLGSVLSFETLQFKSNEWNKYAYDVRALSQLQNCAFNPAFEYTVNFVASGDELHLGRDLQPDELVSRSGKAGKKMLEKDKEATWKHHSDKVPFKDWAVNGVVRGKVLPPVGEERFQIVHGIPFELRAA
jgi:hypothetical protein